eukprot:1358785-Amorphochlora_amoeboformis.AAC.1
MYARELLRIRENSRNYLECVREHLRIFSGGYPRMLGTTGTTRYYCHSPYLDLQRSPVRLQRSPAISD